MQLNYGSHEGNATRFNDSVAWWCVDGKWNPLHPAEVANHAHVLTQAEYEKQFPDLPVLPIQ